MSRLTRRVLTAVSVAAVAAAVAVAGRAAARRLATWRRPAGSPTDFLRGGRPDGTRAVVVCAGDSITHGVVSASFVEPLRARLGGDGYAFVNAGINGNLAWNVLGRLDEMIACRPDAVTLLVGTNDVLGTLGPDWESMYRRQQGIPATPTLERYVETMRAILDRLAAETGARVAILDLPPIGEDLDSPTNDLVRTYNAALRAVAAGRSGVTVLPLHDRLVALLPPGHAPRPFDGTRRLMGAAIVRRAVLRQPWSRISADHGLALLTDGAHLNDRAAVLVADLIEAWLRAPA